MGIGEGINFDTQEPKKKCRKAFRESSRKFVKIEISVQIDSEGVTYIVKSFTDYKKFYERRFGYGRLQIDTR